MELLAPAGSFESLRAAVQNGADAVYLGGTSFSARARAENFADVAAAVRYAHARSTDVHFTLNTLILDREITPFLKEAEAAAAAGVDAFIVQDLGALRLLKEAFPEVPLHASTQLSVTNAQSAAAFVKLGCSRLVLARELPASQIRQIKEETGAELEVFAHGATCVSYSGKCLMSSLAGGRSANRGACAQPCRQCWELNGKRGYFLNTRDLCLADEIQTLKEAGVSSIKLEGRMKGPLYVAAAVQAYREGIDTGHVSKKKLEALELTFMRGGFTKGRFAGDRDRLFPSQPGHTGQLAGVIRRVDRDSLIMGGGALVRAGDEIISEGADQKPRKVREVHEEKNFRRLYLSDLRGFRQGAKIYKVTDEVLVRELARSCVEGRRKTFLEARATVRTGEPLRLQCTMPDGVSFVTEGAVVEEALHRAVTKEEIEEQLRKSGDSPCAFSDICIDLEAGCAVSKKALNAARRDALERARHLLENRYPGRQMHAVHLTPPNAGKGQPRLLLAVCQTEFQARACAPFADLLCVPAALASTSFGVAALGYVPGEISGRELAALEDSLPDPGTRFVECLLADCRGSLAGSGLNATNSCALRVLSDLGFAGAIVSEELNFAQIRDLHVPEGMTLWCMAYGFQPLMVTEHCPVNCSDKSSCQAARGDVFLKDRTGRRMQVIKDGPECRVRILNALPLHSADIASQFRCDGLVLRFTVEESGECARIASLYREALSGKKVQPLGTEATRGHLMRGLGTQG